MDEGGARNGGNKDGIRQKLVDTKERWAREGRGLTGEAGDPERDRLPPGQHLVTNWPVLDLGVQPRIDPALWRLSIDGLVENSVRWSWEELLAQPQVDDVSDIHCVTTWSRYGNRWRGVSAKHLLDVVRPRPEARFVALQSYDTYQTNVPLAAFDDDDVLLATHWEGEPLSLEHGGPLRLILPKLYFWKSAKWLKRVEFLAEDRPGFWEMRGYHNVGDPWAEERYSD